MCINYASLKFSNILELGRFLCFGMKMLSVTDLGTCNGQSYGHVSARLAHAASGFVPAVCGHAAHLCTLYLLFSLCNTQLGWCIQPLSLQSQNICCPTLCEMFKPWLIFSERVRAFPPASASSSQFHSTPPLLELPWTTESLPFVSAVAAGTVSARLWHRSRRQEVEGGKLSVPCALLLCSSLEPVFVVCFSLLGIEDYACLGSALPLSYSPVTEAITRWLHTVGRVHWHSFFLMNAFWRFSEVLCSYTTILQLHIKLFPPDHPPKSLSSPLSLLYFFVFLKLVQVSSE